MESQSLRPVLEPWLQSIASPHQAQEQTLSKLIEGYQKTEYGQEFGADKVSTIAEFQGSFPVVPYVDLRLYIEKVMQGGFSALLLEPPVEWGLTRGTTGESKIIPMTATDLKQKTACGARGLLNYKELFLWIKVLKSGDFPASTFR